MEDTSKNCENEIVLSRLQITGSLSKNTPICVIQEVLEAHCIDYDQQNIQNDRYLNKVIDRLNNDQPHVINMVKATNLDLSLLATFINAEESWKLNSLMSATNYLMSYTQNIDPLRLVPHDFTIGKQKSNNIQSINACMLYRICNYHKIKVGNNTSMQQMAKLIHLLHESRNTLIIRAMNSLHNVNKKDLLSLIISSEDTSDHLGSNQIGYTDLQDAFVSLNNISNLRSMITPQTHAHAVALAALEYKYNIRWSSNPIRSYSRLSQSSINDFVPQDEQLLRIYRINKNLLRLDIVFDVNFPQNYYDLEDLDRMAREAGYPDQQIYTETHYVVLQTEYYSQSFYQGLYPEVTEESTVINMEDIATYDKRLLFSYGSRDGEMHAISYEELADLFTNNRNFTNPFENNSVFSPESLRKLKMLLVGNIYDPTHVLNAQLTLRNAIEAIETYLASTDERSRELLDAYNKCSKKRKLMVKDCLTKLLDMSMYMRGWKGPPYPYTISGSIVTHKEQIQVDLNVTQSMAQFQQYCYELEDIGHKIITMPIVRYRDGRYQPSSADRDGFTIGQRLEIVKDGRKSANMASCIRMSSNWFASSAYKYLTLIGHKPNFDIQNLRNIS